MAEETKEVDVLEQVKRIDKAIKAKLLIEKIALLKEFAREINELREKSIATLEELGLSEKDMKRIIDYINELPEVKLSERDKKNIRDEIHNTVSEEKETTEAEMRSIDLEKFMKLGTMTTTLGYSGTGHTAGTPYAGGMYYCSGTSESLNGNSLMLSAMNNSSYVATLDNGAGEKLTIKL